MAASRNSSYRALQQLSMYSRQTRQLHMTGPSTFPSRAIASREGGSSLPQDLESLQAECSRRSISTSGSKQDLIDRLHNDNLRSARTFASSAGHGRPEAPRSEVNATPRRQFNTSREAKAVNDSSTIDLAYLPPSDFLVIPSPDSLGSSMRMPVIMGTPHETPIMDEIPASARAAPVHQPRIQTVAADSTHISSPSAMAETHDGMTHDQHHKFHEVADVMTNAARKTVLGVEGKEESAEGRGILRGAWRGIVDSVTGQQNNQKPAL